MKAAIPKDVLEALKWQAQRTPERVIQEREEFLQKLEAAGDEMWKKGLCQQWFQGADPQVAKVASTINGVLMSDLCKAVLYEDTSCADLFREGALLYGTLPQAGLGKPKAASITGSIDCLRNDCSRSNEMLLASMVEDPFAEELHKITVEDARLGRMSCPVPVADRDLSEVRLCPRFGVEQGMRDDGSVKLRAVDHMSWCIAPEGNKQYMSRKRQKECSINGCTAMPEEIHHDHIDLLAACMKQFKDLMCLRPALIKADIDSAYRRIPLHPHHRWAAAITYVVGGVKMVADHMACPFGSVSAVHTWERVGAMITTIVRRVLKIALLRYVDDLFAPERQSTAEHALQCVARLIRLLMGTEAIADKKLEWGSELVILGIQVSPLDTCFRLLPAKDKKVKCISVIDVALSTGTLLPGCAEKLAGRLSWAAQFMFYRLGRAMLRPIFDQRFSKVGKINSRLVLALKWWKKVLAMDLCEDHPWEAPNSPVLHMFVDAAGCPARCAAVLFTEDQCLYTDGKPSERILANLLQRKDSQIMALESIAIALGMSTFAPELHKRKVIVFSDNTAAEAATRRGTAKAWDHCAIVHQVWTQAVMNRTHLWIERVDSESNISDCPSRMRYTLLEELGAVWRAPLVSHIFLDDL